MQSNTIASCLLACAVDPVTRAHFLQAAEERLGDLVIPAVAASAHAQLDAMRATEPQPAVAAVRTPWSEWIISGAFGRRRQIAINNASSASSFARLGFID